jgi:hypothetical protein
MYIQGRNSDGSYTLKTGISVVTATGNVPPTVFPGNSSTIVSPASSVTIVGSASDADGTIASTVWTQVSGPSTATLSGATTTTLVASNLVVGTYVFRLTATDNLGATTSADVSVSVITVSVSAGTNQVVQLPTDSTTLTGNQVGLSQPTWSQVSGPNTATIVSPNTLTTKLKGLVVGTYTFRLTMYYSTTAYTSDVSVNVLSAPAPNIPPTANAGADQSITYPSQSSVTLAGSGTDVDGYVVAYQWSQVSGPNTATISPATLPTTTASGLIVGTYKFTLVVVDNQGAASAPDTIQVTVLNAPNIPPVVNAGPDQILNPPNNTSTTLTGSATDADGYIVSYLWSTVSGGSPTIGTPSSSVTTVSNLIPGTTYKFQLVATDNNGGVGRDTVQVISVNNPTTYYIKSVTTKWNTTVSPARKYVLITWTNNTTDRIELSPGGGYITSIKQAYAIVDGGRHLTVTIKFSDNTTQYFAKKIM